MGKNNLRLTTRLLKLILGLAVGATLGCGTSPREEANARKPGETMVSVDSVPREEEPEIDGDVYLPYYNEADLPRLELTPLETPGKATDERLEDLWGDFDPAQPDRPRPRPPFYRPKQYPLNC